MKAQVGVIGGVLPVFVTGIHKDSVRRWNLRFPSAGVFAKVLAGRATGDADYLPPLYIVPSSDVSVNAGSIISVSVIVSVTKISLVPSHKTVTFSLLNANNIAVD